MTIYTDSQASEEPHQYLYTTMIAPLTFLTKLCSNFLMPTNTITSYNSVLQQSTNGTTSSAIV